MYLRETNQGLFHLLDADGDGGLSVREMVNAWRSVREFDQDGDGRVARPELPRQFQLAIGESQYYQSPVQLVRTSTDPLRDTFPPAGPLWFWKLDRNGDRDVSRQEFVGPAEVFDRIDQNGDGLISAEEAEKADRWFRKGRAK